MTADPRETRVLAAVVTLVDSLLDDFDIVELLTELTEHCAQLLDVASAGLLLADARGALHLMAATSEKTQELELFQLQADEGPCLDCYASGRPVTVADLSASAGQWPHFTSAAAQAGFASVHAVPMRAAGNVLGALGLFGTRPGELDQADLLVAQTLSHLACVAILHENPATPATVLPPLQTALVSRVVVEQAKGFLRGSLGVPLDVAFELLRQYAAAHGDHLTKVAHRLINEPASRAPILSALQDSGARPGDGERG